MPEILEEKVVFDEHLKVEEALIRVQKKTFTKQRVNRQDAVAVLIYNTDSDRYVLTRQFRYAISSKISGDILEILAGKVDGNEEPEEAALRETEEETGFHIKREDLRFLASCFVSPGYTSERFYIYYVEVTNFNKRSIGGGLDEENESIEVVEIGRHEFDSMIASSAFVDAKTLLAGLMIKMFPAEP